MAERRPLVVKDGQVQEIPAGDTISTVIAPGSGGGGGGSTDFVSLTDTPANFTDQALKALRVNAAEDALEFTDFPSGGGGGVTVTTFTKETAMRATLTLSAGTNSWAIPANTTRMIFSCEASNPDAGSLLEIKLGSQTFSGSLHDILASGVSVVKAADAFMHNEGYSASNNIAFWGEVIKPRDASAKTIARILSNEIGGGIRESNAVADTATDNATLDVNIDTGNLVGTVEIEYWVEETVDVVASPAAPAVPAVVRDALVTWRNGSSTTAPFPAGALAGDTCVIVASGAWQPSTPAGWTDVASVVASDQQGKAFTRVLTDADIIAGSVTVGWSGDYEHTYSAVAFVGAHTIRYGEVFQDAGGATTPAQVIINSDVTDKMILVGAARASSTTVVSDTGTQLSTAGGVQASASIYEHDPVANGGLTVNWTIGATPNGYTLWAFSAQEIPAIVDGIIVGAAITASQNVTDDLLVGDLWQDVDPSAGNITLTTQLGTIGNQPVTIENVDTTNNVLFAAGASTTINSLNGLTLPPGGVAVLMPKGSGVYRLIGDLIA